MTETLLLQNCIKIQSLAHCGGGRVEKPFEVVPVVQPVEIFGGRVGWEGGGARENINCAKVESEQNICYVTFISTGAEEKQKI